MTWNGAGAWLIFSQSRQVNFSRTCWITFHCRGITSSVSVTSSPNFTQPRAAAAQAGGRSRLDHPLARLMLGEGLACRALAGKRHHIRGLGHGALGGDLVLARRTLEFFERQLDLIEQPHRAFRALPVERARQLRDLQLLMGNHGLVV